MNDQLFLTIKKEWFEQIKAGTKTIEYRENKPYWSKKLLNPDGTPKKFGAIMFQNGYAKNAPRLVVAHVKTELHECFYIYLGEIIKF